MNRNLKHLRLAKHYTQEQAAELLGVGAQTVSRWECGATLPDVMLLPELVRLYCVAIDELYRSAAAAYANEAQRLASVYKASRAPADFVRADQEFRRTRRLGPCTAEELRQWGVMNQFMMCSCMRQAEALFDEALTRCTGVQRGSVKRQRLYFLNLIDRGEEGIREQEALARKKHDAEEEACLIAAYQFAGQREKGYDCFCKAVKKRRKRQCFTRWAANA